MSYMRFGVNAALGKFHVFVLADAGVSERDNRDVAIAVAQGCFSRNCRVDESGVTVASLPENTWGFECKDWYSGKHVSGWLARK